MGIYVDAEDIRQHMRGGTALTVEAIEELMDEQEYYVQTSLDLAELPPGNLYLTSIIRDLTIAAAIYSLTAPNADDLGKADEMRREAIRRLAEADRNGLGPADTTYTPHDPNEEVFDPYPGLWFGIEQFDPYGQLSDYSHSPQIYIIRTWTEEDGYR
jgi:hypothetical protein